MRIVTIVAVVLLVLAGVFYFAHTLDQLVMPLLILGVLALAAGILTGR